MTQPLFPSTIGTQSRFAYFLTVEAVVRKFGKTDGQTGSRCLDKAVLFFFYICRTVESPAIGPHRQTYALIKYLAAQPRHKLFILSIKAPLGANTICSQVQQGAVWRRVRVVPLGQVRCTLDYPPGHGSAQDALRYPPAPLPGVVTDCRAVVIAVPPPRQVQTRRWTRFGRCLRKGGGGMSPCPTKPYPSRTYVTMSHTPQGSLGSLYSRRTITFCQVSDHKNCGELSMPPQCTDTIVSATSISAWFGSLRPRKTPPNPTAKTPWEQVHFSPVTRGYDPDTHTPKPAPTLLVTHRIQKLLTQTPTSQNRSKAIRYLTQHPGTPYTADLKNFASSHYVHSRICSTPHWSFPHPASEFPSTAITDYKLLAQTLIRHRRWDMELGSRFLF